MVLGGIGAAVWLAVTGQAGTVDGLFLVLTALLIAAAFALYLVYMVRRAMEAAKKPAAQTAKAPATSTANKPAPASATQS